MAEAVASCGSSRLPASVDYLPEAEAVAEAEAEAEAAIDF